MSAKSGHSKDAKPAVDTTMGANVKNPALIKTYKKGLQKRRRNDAKTCLLGDSPLTVKFYLLMLLSLKIFLLTIRFKLNLIHMLTQVFKVLMLWLYIIMNTM